MNFSKIQILSDSSRLNHLFKLFRNKWSVSDDGWLFNKVPLMILSIMHLEINDAVFPVNGGIDFVQPRTTEDDVMCNGSYQKIHLLVVVPDGNSASISADCIYLPTIGHNK